MMTLTLKMLGLLEGPGAFAKKIREVHGFNVPRNIVYNLMADIEPEGLQSRFILITNPHSSFIFI